MIILQIILCIMFAIMLYESHLSYRELMLIRMLMESTTYIEETDESLNEYIARKKEEGEVHGSQV